MGSDNRPAKALLAFVETKICSGALTLETVATALGRAPSTIDGWMQYGRTGGKNNPPADGAQELHGWLRSQFPKEHVPCARNLGRKKERCTKAPRVTTASAGRPKATKPSRPALMMEILRALPEMSDGDFNAVHALIIESARRAA